MKNLKSTPATQLLRNGFEKFIAKDMKGWSEL